MDILIIAEYTLLASLAVFSIAAVRIATRRNIRMGLVGISGLNIAIATILILINRMYGIGFCRDIAYALVLLGPVGTIAFARVLRG
nr:monovalent cation/H+ antiporter complex subunit F [Methanothermobacter thermautotrophicus]